MSDIIGESAKDIRNGEMSDYQQELLVKYLPRIWKKMQGKDDATRSIMADTFCMACNILSRIKDIPFYELSMSVFVYCKDEGYRYISKQFEGCLELAGMDEEKFVLSLHSFYNNISSKLRKPGMLKAFSEFISVFMMLRYEKSDRHINPNVILAYTNLILQTFDYLRPEKLKLDKTVVGISMDGTPLTVKDPLSYSQLAQMECLAEMLQTGKEADISKYYRKYGNKDILTLDDAEAQMRKIRIFENMRAALIPFINEYTFDIFPQRNHTGDVKCSMLVNCDFEPDDLKEKLKKRRRALPTNGVKVEFNDSTEEFISLLLKEIIYDNKVYMLYRISVNAGDISGYYEPMSGYFYNPVRENPNERMVNFFECLVLFFYAEATLDDEQFSADKCPKHFSNFIYPIEAKSFRSGGKLRNTYDPDYVPSGKRKADERYEEKEVFINGFVRTLPEGHHASEEAMERAKKLGYDLKANETFVAPFTKSIFCLRDKEPEEDENEDK